MRPILLIAIALVALTSCATRAAIPTHPSTHTATPATTFPLPAPSTPASPSPTLKPPDSDLPASGICGTATGTFAIVLINTDTPSPRCQHVAADQRLRITNNTDRPAEIRLANHALTLAPKTEGTIDQPFGDYLAPGVHTLTISTYSGGGPALWLDR
jgi:hypothetical protein